MNVMLAKRWTKLYIRLYGRPNSLIELLILLSLSVLFSVHHVNVRVFVFSLGLKFVSSLYVVGCRVVKKKVGGGRKKEPKRIQLP